MPDPSSYTPPHIPGGLREQDRYIRHVLWQYPQVPRAIGDPWYPTRNGLYGFFAICAISLSLMFCGIFSDIINLLHAGRFWQSPTAVGAALLGPFTILTLWHLVLHPLYDWHIGLRSGRSAVAVVTSISERPAPNSVRGIWEIRVEDRCFTTKFRQFALEEDTWIQRLREGDRINVLVHPTRDKVLLAYGP